MQEGFTPRMATVLNGIPSTVANLLQITWQREALSPSTSSFRGSSVTLRRLTRVLPRSPSKASNEATSSAPALQLIWTYLDSRVREKLKQIYEPKGRKLLGRPTRYRQMNH
jgi:hypothetical protein